MTPAQAIEQAKTGELLPVYLVAGEERLLRDEVVRELRAASLGGRRRRVQRGQVHRGRGDVEDDRLRRAHGADDGAEALRARPRRRAVGRRGGRRRRRSTASTEYAAAPVDSTCLVIVGVEDRRAAQARRSRRASRASSSRASRSTRASLPAWIVERFAAKGHAVDRDVAELLAALAGPRSVVGRRRHRAALALRGRGRADRRGGRRRVRRARAHRRHLGAGRRRGRARPRARRCGRSPTRTTRASAGCRCSGRWRGRSGSSRATRPRSSRAPRATRRRGEPGSSSRTGRASSRRRRAPSGPRRSSAGCSSWRRPTSR